MTNALGRRRIPRSTPVRFARPRWRQVLDALSRGPVLARLGLCVLAVLLAAVVLRSWEPPFPFHLDQRFARALPAAVEFERPDDVRTEAERSRAADRVPPHFHHDPAPLLAALQADLADVLARESAAELSPAQRQAFGFAVQDSEPLPQQPTPMSGEAFADFRAALAEAGALDRVRAAVADAIAPGLLARDAVTADNLGRSGMVRVIPPEGEPYDVPLTDVEIEPQRQAGSRLHGQLQSELQDHPALVQPIFNWLATHLTGTLRFDSPATQAAKLAARAAVPLQAEQYNAGDILVPQGQPIDQIQLDLLQREHAARVAALSTGAKLTRFVTALAVLGALFLLCGAYAVRYVPLVHSMRHLVIVLALVVLAIGLGYGVSADPWRAEVLVLVLAGMTLAIAYGQQFALLMAFSLSLVLTFATGGDLGRFVVLVGAASTATLTVGSVRSRASLVNAGLACGMAYVALSWTMGILDGQDASYLALDSLRGLWGLAAGLLLLGSLPFVERLFGVVSDISLLELGDVAHPLLHELAQRAPGTYNHSINVAHIADAAAEAIGGNGLLVRVGAYFHDIGKMLKPHYFAENQSDATNRHRNLAPAMSKLIIVGHVRDGVDLAQQHNLPKPIVDFIEQHHGTTLVEYFYHEATRILEAQPDHRTDAEESTFRYPGPKPQTREAAVLMLADTVESASRTLSEPTPARIESLVHGLAMKRLLDGQFDECGLTLREIHTIEDSLIKSLAAIYHARVRYPGQRSA